MVPELSAAAHPVLTGMLFAAGALYAAAFALVAGRGPLARPLVLGGVLVHLAATAGRGLVIGFFPLTSKVESFSGAAMAIAVVALVAWWESRPYLLSVLGAALAALGAALLFPLDLGYPPPLMRTIWYPLHVPLSFLAYGAWLAAAGGAVAWLVSAGPEDAAGGGAANRRDPVWLARIDRLALAGFGLWTLSMLCGGFWGVVAWGAYFLWDPKVVWSAILWFHYAAFVHVRLTPSLRDVAWSRPALALVGAAWVFVAYVGTSFFFGHGSHAF